MGDPRLVRCQAMLTLAEDGKPRELWDIVFHLGDVEVRELDGMDANGIEEHLNRARDRTESNAAAEASAQCFAGTGGQGGGGGEEDEKEEEEEEKGDKMKKPDVQKKKKRKKAKSEMTPAEQSARGHVAKVSEKARLIVNKSGCKTWQQFKEQNPEEAGRIIRSLGDACNLARELLVDAGELKSKLDQHNAPKELGDKYVKDRFRDSCRGGAGGRKHTKGAGKENQKPPGQPGADDSGAKGEDGGAGPEPQPARPTPKSGGAGGKSPAESAPSAPAAASAAARTLSARPSAAEVEKRQAELQKKLKGLLREQKKLQQEMARADKAEVAAEAEGLGVPVPTGSRRQRKRSAKANGFSADDIDLGGERSPKRPKGPGGLRKGGPQGPRVQKKPVYGSQDEDPLEDSSDSD